LKSYQLPSRCIGINDRGELIRIAQLKNIDWDNKILTYEIDYISFGLKSTVKLRVDTSRALLEEIFPEKWLIKYEYNENYPEYLGLPASYSIFTYSSINKQYEFVDKHTLHDKQWGFLRFRNNKGKIIERDTLSFIIVPEER
jgi:hypothetical protein